MFVNNSSPAFILSSVGVGMFGNIKIGVLLLVSHILSSLLIGKMLSYKYKLNSYNNINQPENEILDYKISFETIVNSINKSMQTLFIIFGFMVLFILSNNYIVKLLSYITHESKYVSCFSLCVMEITGGLKSLVNMSFNLKATLVYMSFFLGFSSLSIIFQVYSCIYKNKFKLKNIIIGKLLHGILSGIITYVLIKITWIYEYINVSKHVNYNLNEFKYSRIFSNSAYFSLAIFALHLLVFMILKKKRSKSFL